MPARLVGINHVALEVGDIDEALAWYGRFFELELRGRAGSSMAFVDIGDQFIALARGRSQPPDTDHHFGLVVDDKAALRGQLETAGVRISRPPSLDFRDPWGNHVQVGAVTPGRCSRVVAAEGRDHMLLLVVLALLAIIAFGVGFTIHWLFIVAAVIALVWLISLFTGGIGGRSRSTWW
jgi:catechol 2,3-dioxygenase-like lactoylglutathione lyase family enzyme